MRNEAHALLDHDAVDGGDVFKAESGDVFFRETDDAAAPSQAAQQPEPTGEPADTGKSQEPTIRMLPGASETTLDAPRVGDFGNAYFDVKADQRISISAALRKEDQLIEKNVALFEAATTRYFKSQLAEIARAIGLTEKADNSALSELAPYLRADGTFDPELWSAMSEVERQRLTK